MKQLAMLGLALGLLTVQAQAQTSKSTTKQPKGNDGWGSNDGWGGGGWDAPKKKAPATTKPAAPKAAVAPTEAAAPAPAAGTDAATASPTPPPATGAAGSDAAGFGGAAGGYSGGSTPERGIEGTSVAPGSALRPMSRTRYDYRGRPIEQKPSMRPRE